MPRVVLDTNVVVAGLRSRHGASYRLLSLVGTGRFEVCLSVPLVLEYEAVLGRQLDGLGLTVRQLDDFLDYLCLVAVRQEVFYLWRPLLRDPKDDMVLELAVAASCDEAITFNAKNFSGSDRVGVAARRPQDLLARIGALG